MKSNKEAPPNCLQPSSADPAGLRRSHGSHTVSLSECTLFVETSPTNCAQLYAHTFHLCCSVTARCQTQLKHRQLEFSGFPSKHCTKPYSSVVIMLWLTGVQKTQIQKIKSCMTECDVETLFGPTRTFSAIIKSLNGPKSSSYIKTVSRVKSTGLRPASYWTAPVHAGDHDLKKPAEPHYLPKVVHKPDALLSKTSFS